MGTKLRGEGPLILVDDDQDARRLAQVVVAESRIQNRLLVFGDGAQLMQYLECVERGAEPMPALILLDVNMPATSGFEILKSVRKRQMFSLIPPIVMLSASNDPADRKRSLESGADEYRTKPFEVESFLEFLNDLVPQKGN